MKATVSEVSTTQPGDRIGVSTLMELVKARLTTLVLLTTAVGYYVGSIGPLEWLRLVHTLIGTGLVAAGAAALNELLERDFDARMPRTAERPLPSGKMQPETVLMIGGVSAAVGLAYLAVAVNPLTSLLGAITLVSYLFIYTPLKRVTALNTIIGAIPGALPPLMGWTATRGEISTAGWSLFAILFFWQLPHFLAIAWLYREEYERAGFVMLPVTDPEGHRTARSSMSHTLGLIPVSLSPFLLHLAGVTYLIGALLLGLGFLWCALKFARELTKPSARQLFLASIIYLPLLLGLMVLDKVK